MLRRVLPTLFAVWTLPIAAASDVLETRDGRIVEGSFRGGTQQTIRFEVGGEIRVVPVGEVLAITFQTPAQAAAPLAEPSAAGRSAPRPAAPPGAPAAPAAAPAAPPAASAASRPSPATLRLPAGTRLRVRTIDTIDVRRNAEGDRFAALLEADLVLGDVVIAPARSKVYGRIAEIRTTGPIAARLQLELTDLMIEGRMHTILTGNQQLLEPPAPAAEPAPPANTAAASPRKDRVPGGSRLEFRLLQPFELRVRTRPDR